MPRTQIVAVVPLATVARGFTEVVEVPRCARRSVVVVAGYGPSPGLVPPPRRTITAREVGAGPVRIGIITDGEYGAGNGVEQSGGCLGPHRRARSDVSSADDHGRRARRATRCRHGQHPSELPARRRTRKGSEARTNPNDGGQPHRLHRPGPREWHAYTTGCNEPAVVNDTSQYRCH